MFGSITTCFLEGLGGVDLGRILRERDRITVPVFEKDENCLMRVSTHLYNTYEEIDGLIDSVEKVRAEAS